MLDFNTKKNKKIKVLSLFDGVSIAQQAFKELGFEVEYYASEIDKQAISITQKNHPKTIQLGDIEKVYGRETCLVDDSGIYNEPGTLIDIDLIIGGSPCQDLSIAKNNREGLNGKRSGLFWEYVRILKEVKPKYFILENVASMPKEAKNAITEALWRIEPIMINASLVSAQQRKRLFWVGRLVGDRYKQVKIEQPEDRKIYLKDILESGEAVKEKAYCLTAHQKDFINDFIKRNQGNYVFKDNGGFGKSGQGELTEVSTDSLVVLKDYFRPLTPVECERLQSLPDNYTEGLAKTNRKKLLGNGFNCAVIKHIIKSIL